MSQATILIIDDSATIRRLVDHALTGAGYRLVAAATAEEGIELAASESPDLILLDHQLPGTTGTEVAKQLLSVPAAAATPVVVSSTLRKKAYAEYMDLPNVVDMLPKPYTEDLLLTTVANALSTAAMVVDSQSHGTAVPEVLQQSGEPDLTGRFGSFRVRELLDFLNNAGKSGVLEVESTGERLFFHLAKGRVQGITASGTDVDLITQSLPESLANLAPVVKLTLSGRGGSELDGLVELLNRKVVDPRLLRKLQRHQAAALAWRCFNGEPREFRFTTTASHPPLISKLPLELSVLALLIDGALACDASTLPNDEEQSVYVRRAIRGQNLDRTGVAAQHIKILNLLGDRHSAAELASKLAADSDEVRRVLLGMCAAELVDRAERSAARNVVIYETEPRSAGAIREALSQEGHPFYGKVVRDRLALQLVLRRAQPDAFIFNLAADDALALVRELRQASEHRQARWIGMIPSDADEAAIRQQLTAEQLELNLIVERPSEPTQLFELLHAAFEQPAAVCPDLNQEPSSPQPSWAGSA